MKKLSHFTKVISFKLIVKFFFTILILLILLMLYDMANYDSSYLNRRSLTFSVDNLDSKKTINFVRYYDNLYHKIAFKISKDYKEYWKPEKKSLRADLPEIKIISKKKDNFLPGRKLEEIEKNFSNWPRSHGGFSSMRFSSLKLINNSNFNYRELKLKELENLYLTILKRIELDKQKIGVKERTKVWQDGWSENLDKFIKSDYDIKSLVPKFIKGNQPVRLNQRYVLPQGSQFELDYIKVYRQWFLENYFSDFDNIYEFGCGTGFNLLTASEIFPNKSLYGSDFVQSSVDLVNTIAKSKNIQLSGSLFNMLNPNYEYKIKNNSGVFTFGSIEQLASRMKNIINYFIEQKPEICLHTEPMIELYDQNKLSDFLAMKYQSKRGYTKGLLPYLQSLELEGKIKIIKVKFLPIS